MAPRPNWKGYLKLSLVSCPVSIYPASSGSERVAFRQVNKKTGNRLRQQLVDSGTGEVVDSEDKGRGFEVGKDQYILIKDEEIEAIQVESTRTIAIDRFVNRADIDPRYIDSPYYIIPNDRVGQDAFAVIREAMREEGMAALARVVIAKRERIIMLEPLGKGLLATTLRYAYEVRGEEDYFEDIPDQTLPADMRELARHIVQSKVGKFDPKEFEDRYENALVEMLKTKQAGLPAKAAAAAPAPAQVVNRTKYGAASGWLGSNTRTSTHSTASVRI